MWLILLPAIWLPAAYSGATQVQDTAPSRVASAENAQQAAPRWVEAPPAEALRMLVLTERAASIQGDEALLTQLWAEDGRIRDGRGTTTRADDYLWKGRWAILDRYRLAVFPSPPPPLTDPTLARAEIEMDTSQNGAQMAILRHGQDEWRMVQREGRWWLHSLTYSVPSP